MSDDSNTDDGEEYRPTDYLALCGMSYGIGAYEEPAIIQALRYAGPWEDRDEPVTLAVWELYADSWQSHNPTGPERGAEWLSLTKREIPAEEATEVSNLATDTFVALDRALAEGETVEERTPEEIEA